jgi:hypothetical protein
MAVSPVHSPSRVWVFGESHSIFINVDFPDPAFPVIQYIPEPRLGYDPIRIDPGSILDRIKQDRTGLSRIDLESIL